MELISYGAAGEVTGSKHVVTIGTLKVLFDCGMFQGSRERAQRDNKEFPFEAASISAVVLSHGHLDHCGSLPTLVKAGFRGPIFATAATRDVAELMLRDSAKIQTQDAEYHNRHLFAGQEPAIPLYEDEAVDRVMSLFHVLEYGQCYPIPQIGELCFYNSGHILGSALAHLVFREGSQTVRLAYTGDLGKTTMPILEGPTALPASDVLVCESTYGNRTHEALPVSAEKLSRIIQEAVEKKAKIFVPAFALGRMQTLIYTLHQLTDEGKIPRIPIYVDSPLAVEMTKVFTKHPECFDEETRRLFTARGEEPFGFRNLHYVASVDESKRLNATPGPMMILATAGMADAGRILHHFMNGLADPNNTVLIVGYMAQGTLGRAILEGATKVRIFHRDIPVRARVEKLNAYSAHADKNELLDFILNIPELKKVFLVHGEEEVRDDLRTELLQRRSTLDVHLPRPSEHFTL